MGCPTAPLLIGTGYWFRNQHELLLVGTGGDVRQPLGDGRPVSDLGFMRLRLLGLLRRLRAGQRRRKVM